jgi:hypothetical protein
MSSSIEICSNALLLLGDKPIASFAENNDRTRIVSNIYEMKRDKVLRLNDWKCARKRVILSPDATAPAFEWGYRFLLPDDWLRTVMVGPSREDQDDYETEGRYLLMNTGTCYLTYTYRNENEATWDALLIDVMTEVMKAALAYPITKSTSKQATEEEIVRQAMITARGVDAQDNPPETFGDAPILSNRLR